MNLTWAVQRLGSKPARSRDRGEHHCTDYQEHEGNDRRRSVIDRADEVSDVSEQSGSESRKVGPGAPQRHRNQQRNAKPDIASTPLPANHGVVDVHD